MAADDTRTTDMETTASPAEGAPRPSAMPLDPPDGENALAGLWSRPGGDEEALRASRMGANGQTDGHDAQTAAETPPENIAALSDASLPEDQSNPTLDAFKRQAEAQRRERDDASAP